MLCSISAGNCSTGSTSFSEQTLSAISLNTGSATRPPVSLAPRERLSSKPIRTANRDFCRAQRDPGDLGISGWMPLCSARSSHEVLPFVSVCGGGRRCEDHDASRQKSESERLCGTLSSIRQGGVSVEVDSVRRRPVPDPGRVQRALSRRTQSSGQRQQVPCPGCCR